MLTNAERALSARRAMTQVPDYFDLTAEQALTDLLTNIMHAVDQGVCTHSFEELLGMAQINFEAEKQNDP